MPVYQYRDLKRGGIVELVRKVEERDRVEPHLERITVPARVSVRGTSSDAIDEHSADFQVPRAYKQLEEQHGNREFLKEGGFSVDQVREAWSF